MHLFALPTNESSSVLAPLVDPKATIEQGALYHDNIYNMGHCWRRSSSILYSYATLSSKYLRIKLFADVLQTEKNAKV